MTTAKPTRSGKVRDLYDLGDKLLLVASDRISAFDWILPSLIPDKGRILTQISLFWFDFLNVPNHLISDRLDDIELPEGLNRDELVGRTMVVKKCDVVPIECVVRGYLVGSGWRDYQRTGAVCGHVLEAGLPNCVKFAEPLFTPATKADSGHDENIAFDEVVNVVGAETANELRRRSIDIYRRASSYAAEKGIILADTKFEFGWHGNDLTLIDEVLTPDSSRFWPADQYRPGQNQPSFDKQFVREYLETTTWDKNSPPPELPEAIIDRTRAKYIEAYERLTEKEFRWK
ncbi:MAG: phosphoribosylaminoimidazolesuccinocarboxamide synthase [Pirellulaceae bacterium]